jgi:hypothetical protein
VAFEESSARALEVLGALVTTADQGRAQMLDVRDRILAATERFEGDWALLRERARTFLEQSAAQEQQLVALRTDAGRAADALRGRVQELDEQGDEDSRTTQAEFDELAADTEEDGEKLAAVFAEAEEAEEALTAGLRDVEAELAEVMGEADQLLRGTLAADARHVEQEVERGAIELSAFLTGQCVPALVQKAYDLYTFLVQAEGEIRSTLDASLEANESAAESVLRECGDAYDDTLSELSRLGSALEELLDDVREFVEDRRDTLGERKQRWDEALRRGRDGLREAIESLREAEQYLSRFSFGGR